ncbi:energy-coupling factor transporter ATPase [Salisediminibacterium halotolerans]|uniref:energy-coupling factor transporter ATPase n=1 Tax=Salisediminibacterium halotolerans TaxID=517425 RepID=UPI000EAD29D9|nr:energy-coupling factor transporter ATPase [Salisediminibacterium halotolerans]RLJ73106.1 energy-coupling factor transport system ATP-binding protein [Actinophytocola xinjiangensis]RPE86528.1 energy-coupling factor transport system ATP-binding protein [Salisediminibacterium halotolerans]TWG33903.1 energy-coupling factor transport system ATP-binding protein [Salisediminibacterium halotolerans]GEL07439.1 energy-coupling factor transporter ATP-binding protein EcfA2 [Salisediminibacterium halotol
MQIKTNNLSYIYMPRTPFERTALEQVTLEIPSGQFTAVLGQTGSGKSTLVQHFNGLLKPTAGSLTVGDTPISPNTKQRNLQALRRRVGMVFQFPEHQLFDETVLDDVMYGPLNFGFDREEAEQRARKWLAETGISEALFDRSPFDLSGGQMRRVAIAGVLALEPEMLVLDEPTAGLDPEGQATMMQFFHDWYKAEPERSVVLVTHNIDDAAAFADDIIVMSGGDAVMHETPEDLFERSGELAARELGQPRTVSIIEALADCGPFPAGDNRPLTLDAAADRISRWLETNGRGQEDV